MAIVFCNGCFDILHEGHKSFLLAARMFGGCYNTLVVAVNTDESARRLKSIKWGPKYPINDVVRRCEMLRDFADNVFSFDTEEELHGGIESLTPCVIVKGPDYIGKHVTGEDIAPVFILNTPEPESVRQLKRQAYGLDGVYNGDRL